MNLLFLTQEYPPETGWGGVGTYTRNLAHALVQIGHQVHVLAAAVPPQATYEYDDHGVHVIRLQRRKFEIPLLRRLWFQTAPWTKHQWEYFFTVHQTLARLVKQYAIDCIEGTEIWGEGLLYSLSRNAPLVVKLNGPLFLVRELNSMSNNFDWKLVDRADRRWVMRADQLTAASDSLARLVSAKYQIERANIVTIPNPVNTSLFAPNPSAQSLEPTILYTGRLEPRKGVKDLVKAIPIVLQSYPNARFVFVGADTQSLQAELEDFLRRAGARQRVEFVGHIAHDDIVRYYQASTLCVFPSLYEPFGNVCLEAMACAKPVVATHRGGFSEIVQDGETGLLVPPQDVEALANGINTILANPAQARTWGEHGRKRVEQTYSSEVVAKQTLELYGQVISRWKHNRNAA